MHALFRAVSYTVAGFLAGLAFVVACAGPSGVDEVTNGSTETAASSDLSDAFDVPSGDLSDLLELPEARAETPEPDTPSVPDVPVLIDTPPVPDTSGDCACEDLAATVAALQDELGALQGTVAAMGEQLSELTPAGPVEGAVPLTAVDAAGDVVGVVVDIKEGDFKFYDRTSSRMFIANTLNAVVANHDNTWDGQYGLTYAEHKLPYPLVYEANTCTGTPYVSAHFDKGSPTQGAEAISWNPETGTVYWHDGSNLSKTIAQEAGWTFDEEGSCVPLPEDVEAYLAVPAGLGFTLPPLGPLVIQ